jgi:hypothetical protein
VPLSCSATSKRLRLAFSRSSCEFRLQGLAFYSTSAKHWARSSCSSIFSLHAYFNSLHFVRNLLHADLILIKPLVFRQPNNHANRPLVTLDVYLTANHFFTSLQGTSSLLKVNSEYFFIQISLIMTSFSENVAGLAWAVGGGCICGRPCRYAPL